MRTKSAWVGLVLTGALLASCSSGSSNGGNGPAEDVVVGNDLQPDGGTPQPGGIFYTTTTTEAPTLDPQKAASAYTQGAVSGSVYSKLLEFKSGRGVPYGTSETEGDLAESYKSSDDGLTWTFTLRKGVKWQNIAPVNGRAFTSADVVCTMDRIRTLPGVQNNLLVVVDNWTAPDDYTVVFKLKEAYAAFNETVAHYYMEILPCEGTSGKFDLAQQAIGTGPFMLTTWDRKVSKVYKKNPDYYVAGKPYVDEIHQAIITDPATGLAQFRAGQLDNTTVSEQLLASVQTTNPDAFVRRDSGTTEAITFMNQNVKPFDDIRVRKAVMLALDRKSEAAAISSPDYKLSGPIPPLLFGGMTPEESDKATPYDPTAAKKLLADAGFPNGFDITLTTSDGWGPYIINRAQFTQEDLKAIGINATLKVLDYATFYSTWQAEDYQIGFGYLTAMLSADEYLSSLYATGGTRNWFNISDPKLDALIAEQRGILDKDERAKKLAEINTYILQNVANPVMSYTVSNPSVQAAYVHDVWTSPLYATGYWRNLWLGPDAPGRK
ncbi:MAG: peptide transporter substrate-binding protein [Pseudonocardiales bacterium]|nr:peptide transporter substrate-binding protein [Pseudonocardiales bacterium]